MPELAEVKLMGDFVNYVASQERFYNTVEKSSVSKVKTELDPFDGGVFTISAETRGKEMMLNLELVGGNLEGQVVKKLLVTLGMSGNWAYVRKDSEYLEKILKHSHLRLQTTLGNYLVLHDIRRFAKWKWVDGWSKNRGPCPLTEYNDFYTYLLEWWYKAKSFNVPLNELLMNQSYFNGIGNYLRAEILYRLDINPFQPANSISPELVKEVIKMSHMCCRDAYTLGGGQLKDWKNPNGTEGKDFKEWMKCYGTLSSVIDKTGRRFWYHPKWEDYVPKDYTQKKSRDI